MTIGAINAFLKNCEEPLPNRIIIATTSNRLQLLDTVLSRAILIPFAQLSNQEMNEFAKANDIFQDDLVLQGILISMSMGRP